MSKYVKKLLSHPGVGHLWCDSQPDQIEFTSHFKLLVNKLE